jgi:poly-beta-1,6-N-acetyl-D-glucosamine N-deacetylase
LEFKRGARNSAGTVLAIMLIALGYVRRAKKQAFQKDVILAIAFHNPTSKLFRKIVYWLQKNGFVFISSGRLIDILNKKEPCPRGAVWISLDDGWQGNASNVLPLAVQYNIPITIFVCTDAIEEGTYWWRKVSLSPHLIPVEFRQVNSIKKLPENERHRIIELIDRTANIFPREAMTIEEIKRIASIPQVNIGAHTASHPILPNCPERQVEYELEESKRKLEEWTGKKITTFAYPNGSFDGRERRPMETYGYELAATTESKFATADTDAYLFPRNLLMDDGSFLENLCHALGVWEPAVKKLKQLAR